MPRRSRRFAGLSPGTTPPPLPIPLAESPPVPPPTSVVDSAAPVAAAAASSPTPPVALAPRARDGRFVGETDDDDDDLEDVEGAEATFMEHASQNPAACGNAGKLAGCFASFLATLDVSTASPQQVIAFWESRNKMCRTRTYAVGHDEDCECAQCPRELQYETLLAYHWQLHGTPIGTHNSAALKDKLVKQWRSALRRRQHACGRFSRPATPMFQHQAESIAMGAQGKYREALDNNAPRIALKYAQFLALFTLDLKLGRRALDITRAQAANCFTTALPEGRGLRLHLELSIQKVLNSPKYCYVDQFGGGDGDILCPLRWLEAYLVLARRAISFGSDDGMPFWTPYLFPQFVHVTGTPDDAIIMRQASQHASTCKESGDSGCTCTLQEWPTVTTAQMNKILKAIAAEQMLGHLDLTFHGIRSALALVKNEEFNGDTSKINRFMGWTSATDKMQRKYCRAVQCYVAFARCMPTIDEVEELSRAVSDVTRRSLAGPK